MANGIPRLATRLAIFVSALGFASAASAGALIAEAPANILFEPVTDTRGLVLAFIAIFIAIQSSEDLGCIATGFLVADGFISFGWGVAACFTGIVVGDFALYLLGRYGETTVLKWRWLQKKLTPARLDRFRDGFHKSSFWMIVLSRFVPGSRIPVYFLAGMMGMPLRRFLIYLGVTAGLWTPFLIWISMVLGSSFLDWFEANKLLAIAWLVAIACALWLFIHWLLPRIGRWWRWRWKRTH